MAEPEQTTEQPKTTQDLVAATKSRIFPAFNHAFGGPINPAAGEEIANYQVSPEELAKTAEDIKAKEESQGRIDESKAKSISDAYRKMEKMGYQLSPEQKAKMLPEEGTNPITGKYEIGTLGADQWTPDRLNELRSGLSVYGQTADLSGLQKAINAQKGTLTEMGNSQADQAIAEQEAYGKTYQEGQKFEQERKDQLLKDQEVYDTKLSQINEKIDHYSKSPANVAQAFHDRTTGGKILGGIALFLGAAPHGTEQNSALQAMQAAVDADLNKQKADIENSKGAFKDFYEVTKDKRAASLATYALHIQNTQNMLNSIASQYKGQQVQLNNQFLGQGLQTELEKVKAELNSQLMAASSKGQDKSRELYVPAYDDFAATKEDAAKLKEQTSGFFNASSGLRELRKITDIPFASLTPSQKARAAALIPIITGELRKPVVGTGQFSDTEQKILKEAIGNPTAVFTLQSSNKKKIDTLLKAMDNNIEGLGKAYGLRNRHAFQFNPEQ